MNAGSYELPTLRRLTDDGWSDEIAIADATDEELALLSRELAVYESNVVAAARNKRRAVMDARIARINGAA